MDWRRWVRNDSEAIWVDMFSVDFVVTQVRLNVFVAVPMFSDYYFVAQQLHLDVVLRRNTKPRFRWGVLSNPTLPLIFWSIGLALTKFQLCLHNRKMQHVSSPYTQLLLFLFHCVYSFTTHAFDCFLTSISWRHLVDDRVFHSHDLILAHQFLWSFGDTGLLNLFNQVFSLIYQIFEQ